MNQGHRSSFRFALLAPRYWPMWLVLGLYALLSLLPPRALGVLGDIAASLHRRLPSRRREIARINLKLCFPELSEGQREQILRRHTAVVTHVFMNYGILLFRSASRLVRVADVEGREHLDRLQRERRNTIVLSAHVAALEHMGQWLTIHQKLVSVIRVHEGNDVLDWMMTRMRARQGAVMFSHRSSMVPLVRAVKDGAWLYLLTDDDQRDPRLVFAPFYGVQKASWATLPRLAAACGAVVLPMASGYCVRRRRFWIRFLPPVELKPAADPATDAAIGNALLERIIDVDPAQYMWSMKIFRSRPGGAANPY